MDRQWVNTCQPPSAQYGKSVPLLNGGGSLIRKNHSRLVSGLLTLRIDHSISGVIEQHRNQINARLVDGRPEDQNREDREREEREVGNRVVACGVRLGGHKRITTWEPYSHGCGASMNLVNCQKEGEEGFPSGNPSRGAHQRV